MAYCQMCADKEAEIFLKDSELRRAKELLQELADAVKEDSAYDDLHYKIISFLNQRRRIQPLDRQEPM